MRQLELDYVRTKKVERFGSAVKRFHESEKTPVDYIDLLKEFEACCGVWTWEEILSMIRMGTNQPVECVQKVVQRGDYIEELESALIDVLAGRHQPGMIEQFTCLSLDRCQEIHDLFKRVDAAYAKRHGLS